MIRLFSILATLVVLAACTPATPEEPLEDLGAFKLGHNIVIADKARMVPGSRAVSKEEWVASLTREMDARFAQYRGDQLYHFGISVEGFFVAPPGVPVVFSPKSALVINVSVWDDAAGKKLNAEPEQFTIFETATTGSVLVGAGHVRTRDEQLRGLSRNAIGVIEDWLIAQRKEQGWFEPRAKPETAPSATPGTLKPLE